MVVGLRALGVLGLRAYLPGAWPTWPHRGAATVLICWKGERLPYPTLDPWRTDKRQAAIVGLAPGLSGDIDTFADVSLSDGVYHFAAVAFGPGGVAAELAPLEVRTRVFDGGELLGLLPNVPSLVQVKRLPGNKPCVRWCYSRAGEQVRPDHFEVFARDEETDFDFDNPAASVSYVDRRTRYRWTGTALSLGDVRRYTVRAVSSDGVKSLIPRNGRCPAGEYHSVGKGYCARLEIPAGPPDDIGTLSLEVFDAG